MRLSDIARKKKFEKRGNGREKRATKRRDGEWDLLSVIFKELNSSRKDVFARARSEREREKKSEL